MATSAPTSGDSATLTLTAGQSYIFTATPGAGGSIDLLWSLDNTNWTSFSGGPFRSTQSGAVPSAAIYLKARAYGATGSFDATEAPLVGFGYLTAAQAAAVQSLVSKGGTLLRPPGRIATRQIATRMAARANGATGYTWHTNVTVEDDVVAVRPLFNNIHTSTVGLTSWAVAPTASLVDPINPTGAWINGTCGVLQTAGTTLAVRLGAEQPSLSLGADWLDITSIPNASGARYRYLMFRHFITNAATANPTISEGNYDITAWSSAAFTNGRVWQTFRQDVDGITTKANFTSTTPYAYPGLMGFQYLLRNGSIRTICGIGDDLMEGAVNTGGGTNFGNGWLWQSVQRFRAAFPDTLVEVCNLGISGQNSTTFMAVGNERIPRLQPDLVIYSPFSPNDTGGALTAAAISTMSSNHATIEATAKLWQQGKIIVGGCPNTALAWDAGSDALRRQGNRLFRGQYHSDYGYIDMEADLWNGATAFAPGVSDNGTHPSEAACALVAANRGFPALRKVLVGY